MVCLYKERVEAVCSPNSSMYEGFFATELGDPEQQICPFKQIT